MVLIYCRSNQIYTLFPIVPIELIDSDWSLDSDSNVTLHPLNVFFSQICYQSLMQASNTGGIATGTEIYRKHIYVIHGTTQVSLEWISVERKKLFLSLFLLRVGWVGWSMLMPAYNAHCMLIQCSQKVFIKFASRRCDDTRPPFVPPILTKAAVRFWLTVL